MAGFPAVCVLLGLLLLLLGSGSARALSTADLTFYVPFDGSLEPALAAGKAQPVVSGDPQFEPGVSGSGVVLGGPEVKSLYRHG
jgi:hypothetical protein